MRQLRIPAQTPTGQESKFCHFCFKDGKFTEPDITAGQMIEKVVGIMKLMNLMPEEQVRRR